SLATDRPKRGEHRMHVAVRSFASLKHYGLTLAKAARDRAGEEDVLASVMLNALATAFGIPQRLSLAFRPDEQLQTRRHPLGVVGELFQGTLQTACIDVHGQAHHEMRPALSLLPGSFNPVHDGHWRLREVAARLTGLPLAFELSVTNADKPPLPAAEVYRRIG